MATEKATKHTLTLDRPAKKKGGDRYVVDGKEDWTFYIPQEVSRPDGKILNSLEMTLK